MPYYFSNIYANHVNELLKINMKLSESMKYLESKFPEKAVEPITLIPDSQEITVNKTPYTINNSMEDFYNEQLKRNNNSKDNSDWTPFVKDQLHYGIKGEFNFAYNRMTMLSKDINEEIESNKTKRQDGETEKQESSIKVIDKRYHDKISDYYFKYFDSAGYGSWTPIPKYFVNNPQYKIYIFSADNEKDIKYELYMNAYRLSYESNIPDADFYFSQRKLNRRVLITNQSKYIDGIYKKLEKIFNTKLESPYLPLDLETHVSFYEINFELKNYEVVSLESFSIFEKDKDYFFGQSQLFLENKVLLNEEKSCILLHKDLLETFKNYIEIEKACQLESIPELIKFNKPLVKKFNLINGLKRLVNYKYWTRKNSNYSDFNIITSYCKLLSKHINTDLAYKIKDYKEQIKEK